MEKLELTFDDLTEGIKVPVAEMKKKKAKPKRHRKKKEDSNYTGTKEDTRTKPEENTCNTKKDFETSTEPAGKEHDGHVSLGSKTYTDKSKSNDVPFGQYGKTASTCSRPQGDQSSGARSHTVGRSNTGGGTPHQERGYGQRPLNSQRRQYQFKEEGILESVCSHIAHDNDHEQCNEKVRYSKKLSNILRHSAHEMGFQMDTAGYVYVNEILKHKSFRSCSVDFVKGIVQADAKQRFSLKGEGKDLKICANQGHSFEVAELEIEEITDASNYDTVVHGTYSDAWEQIKMKGLSRMKRQHIHFCMGEPGDKKIISGARQSANVLIYISMAKALQDGFKFYLSQNNVILCPGNQDGFLPPMYFKAVKDRSKANQGLVCL